MCISVLLLTCTYRNQGEEKSDACDPWGEEETRKEIFADGKEFEFVGRCSAAATATANGRRWGVGLSGKHVSKSASERGQTMGDCNST